MFVRSDIAGRNIQQLPRNFHVSERSIAALDSLGFNFGDTDVLHEMANSKFLRQYENQMRKFGMDSYGQPLRGNQRGTMDGSTFATQPLVTMPGIAVPVQFLQNWLPGFVFVMTAPRIADELMGVITSGSWEDSQVVVSVLERIGTAVPYGDRTNIPESSWNVNFVTRTNIRFEAGLSVGRLETAEAARMRVDNPGTKRRSAALDLEIIRNAVGFFGYNNGNNNTYGFLNDPNLSSYVEVAEGASTSTLWSTKTTLEIAKDIRTAIVALRTQTLGLVDPERAKLTLALPVSVVDWLSTFTDFGITDTDWLKRAYPNIRVISAPQLDGAHSGDNVFYLYAEEVNDDSTDDSATWAQVVPAKFQVLGVEQLVKSYKEDYTNSTAGAFLKRPYALVRYYGI